MASNRIKGITIEIGGDTTKLDKALAATNKELKSTQASLKDVDRLLKLDPGNTELLVQKQRLLSNAMEETRQKADTLREAVANGDAALARGQAFQDRYAPLLKSLDEAAAAYERLKDQKAEMDRQMELGEISTEQYDQWNAKMKESQAELRDLRQQVADAKAEMGGSMIDQSQFDAMQRELIETESELKNLAQTADETAKQLDGLDDATGGAADGLDDLGDGAGGAAGGLGGLNQGLSAAAGGLGGLKEVAIGAAHEIGKKLVDAAIEAVEWIWSLDEATEEYREAIGKLNTAFESSGFSAEKAKEIYGDFYNILGDTDKATEASQLLANMYNSENELASMTELLSEKYGFLGSTIPVDELVKAATEAAKTGEVTGVLAKTIQMAGGNTEIFEWNLKSLWSEGGKNINKTKIVMDELARALFGEGKLAESTSASFYTLSEKPQNLSRWTDIAAGVYGTFGDSLPIEGLIEAANETAKVGEVTGVLADALNWVGIREDEFNEALLYSVGESGRAALITETLAGAYDDAAESFYKNNETLMATRENQAKMEDVQAKLGESVAALKNKFFELFGPALIAAMDAVSGILNGLITVIDKIGEALEWLGEKIQGVIGFFEDLFGVSQKASNIPVDTDGGNTRAAGGSRALRMASAESLPYLAQGTVTRPNSPFMAVVGDNPNEPEIVSPLSTIEQAVRNVVGSGGGQINDVRVTVNFTGSLAQVARLMQPQITAETNRLGPQLAK